MASQTGDFNAKWTEELTTHFVNLLIDEVKKGNQSSQTFNRNGWANILLEFPKKTGLAYSLGQLKNKCNKLRGDYSSFKKLLSTTGFGWNHANRTVTVDDESVWELHTQENKEWKKFKKQCLRQWPELQMLFDDTYATRDNSVGNVEFH